MDSHEEESEKDESSLLEVEEFLSEFYPIFTVAGILAGLSVYLKEFQGAASTVLVNLGVISALIIFTMATGFLILQAVKQAVFSESLNLQRVIPYSIIIASLAGLMITVIGITFTYKTQLVLILDGGTAIAIFIGYLIVFPREKFQEIEGVSEDVQSAIENAPGIAMNFAIFSIYLSSILLNSSGWQGFAVSAYTKLESTAFGEPNLMFPLVIPAIATQFVGSFVLKKYYIWKD